MTNAVGASNTVNTTLQQVAPALFLFDPEGRKYVADVHVDGTFATKPGLFGGGVITRAAKPGDRILLYGTGFGPTMSGAAIGEIPAGADPLAGSARLAVSIGKAPAQVEYAGLVSPGLYQFNVIVPEVPAADREVLFQINGVRSISTTLITVAEK